MRAETSPRRPVLLIDVDGVLNVWEHGASPPAGWEIHEAVTDGLGQAWRLVLNRVHGTWLCALAEEGLVDLVWCTTWWRVANAQIAGRVGLPDLPAVFLPYRFGLPPTDHANKTPFVKSWAAERGIRHLAWLDDDVDECADRKALTAPPTVGNQRLAGLEPVEDALVIRVDPRSGLTLAHVERVRAWAMQVSR